MRMKTAIATALMVVVPCICAVRAADRSPLADAAERGDAAAVRALLARAADVGAAQGDGMTALHWAAQHGDAVTALLELSADANAVETANGETALMFAAARDRADAVRALVQRGADAAIASRTIDLSTATPPEEVLQNQIRDEQ